MSWDSYITDHLMVDLPNTEGLKLSHAAIVGKDGLVWAKSDNFPEPTEEQVQALVKGFDDGDALGASGIKLGDLKWGLIADGHQTGKPKPVFPRIVIEEE